MWTLSGFADEIDPDLDVQVATIAQLGLNYLEFRSAWDINVLDLSDAQVSQVGETLTAAGLRVSAIGTPIGKIGIEVDFAPHVDRMRRAVDVAQALQTNYSRVFAFFTGSNQPAQVRDEA